MSVEDRVRTATRDRADLVRDIRPLELPAIKALRLPRPRRIHGWSMWLAPVTAAAVVVALAVTLVSLRQVRDDEPSGSGSAQSTTPVTALATGVPKYYSALYDTSGTAFYDQKTARPVYVAVGDVSTGQQLASFTPPSGQTFAGVTAAADDRTFVVAAQSFPVAAGYFSTAPVAWYLLRLRPGSKKAATLTKLSIPGQPKGTQVDGIALSPDGSKLAVMFQRGVWLQGQTEGPLTLSVYSVSTGKTLHTWTQAAKFPAGYGWYWGRYSNSSISWLAGGHTLAFDDGNLSGENGPPFAATFADLKIRTIKLASPDGDLLTESKVVFTSENHWCIQLQLAANGKTVFCGSYGGDSAKKSSAYDPEIIEYSVATGKGRVIYRLAGRYNQGMANILWLSSDGSKLVGAVYAGDQKGRAVIPVQQEAGPIDRGTLKPKIFPLAGTPYVGEIAF